MWVNFKHILTSAGVNSRERVRDVDVHFKTYKDELKGKHDKVIEGFQMKRN